MILRRIYGPKGNETTGGRIKLHRERASSYFVVCSLPDIVGASDH
jgi:hypothetical protein